MIIPLSPRLHSLKELQVQLAVARGIDQLLEDIVADALEEDEEASPDEVGEAGRGAEEEGALGALLPQQGRRLPQVRGGGLERRVAALLPRQLVQRHPEPLRPRLVPVRLAGLVEDPLRHQGDVDAH